jgi:hypothetical protein
MINVAKKISALCFTLVPLDVDSKMYLTQMTASCQTQPSPRLCEFAVVEQFWEYR